MSEHEGGSWKYLLPPLLNRLSNELRPRTSERAQATVGCAAVPCELFFASSWQDYADRRSGMRRISRSRRMLASRRFAIRK